MPSPFDDGIVELEKLCCCEQWPMYFSPSHTFFYNIICVKKLFTVCMIK